MIRLKKKDSITVIHIKYLIAFDIQAVRVASELKIRKIPAALINIETGVVEKVFRKNFHSIYTIAPPALASSSSSSSSSLSPLSLFTSYVKAQNECALYAFDNWITMTCQRNSLIIPKVQSDFSNPNLNCLLCIWNDNDIIGVSNIFNECNRIDVDIPDCLKLFFEMRELFEKFVNMKDVSLENALKLFGKKIEGRKNYIVNRVINIARLSAELIKQSKCVKIRQC